MSEPTLLEAVERFRDAAEILVAGAEDDEWLCMSCGASHVSRGRIGHGETCPWLAVEKAAERERANFPNANMHDGVCAEIESGRK